jgi:hypothetical protein
MPVPKSERSLAASQAANYRWAMVPNRSAATAKSRAAFDARFEDLVDPDQVLHPEERAKRVANARRAHFQALALKSAQARRRAREVTALAEVAETELEQFGGSA